MAKRRMPTHIAVVCWLDAFETAEATDIEELATQTPLYPKITTGFLLAETEHHVTLSQELNFDLTAENSTNIPQGMIKRMRRWKIPKTLTDILASWKMKNG